MKDALFALLGLICAGVAAWFFYSFQTSGDEGTTTTLILGVVFAILAIGFGAFFMFNRVNRHEDIHVTE